METITKKELENILDKKLSQYQDAIIEAADFKFKKVDNRFDEVDSRFDALETVFEHRFQKVESEIGELRLEIRRLAVTLDNFVKMMTDYKEEFIILKGEVDQIKRILKQKLGVEIANQA